MQLAESLRNPWGILHGGAVASLIDLTAEHVTGGITTDVVLHFLAPNRVGPGAVGRHGLGIARRRNRAAHRSARRGRRPRDRARGRDRGTVPARRRDDGSRDRGVYPGSFDPPTIAHVAIAEAAVRAGALDRLDLAISRVAAGQGRGGPATTRRRASRRSSSSRHRDPGCGVVVTDAQLITDIAVGVRRRGDGRRQVGAGTRSRLVRRLRPRRVTPRSPGSPACSSRRARASRSSAPRRSNLPEHLGAVSSSAARAGNHDLIAPECRPAGA